MNSMTRIARQNNVQNQMKAKVKVKLEMKAKQEKILTRIQVVRTK